MADHSLSAILRRLGRQAAVVGPGSIADTDLLQRYAHERDAAAFELIVWRHGATVWGACRRSLTRLHDAEDAFQAVFMVLARKAGSVRCGECLGGWLHRVAVRVARRAQARVIRDGERERGVEVLEAPVEDGHAEWSDLGPAVDEEIDRLPARFRTAFVLCHLQGHTCDEAARRLGCARGTILSRLARARDRLKERLTRRGITLSSAALVSLASGSTAAAARTEPATHAALTFASKLTAGGAPSSAALLSQEVMRIMFISKLKLIGCVLAVMFGIGAFGWNEFKSGSGEMQTIALAYAGDKTPAAKETTDLEKLQGRWNMLYAEQAGRKDDDVMSLIFEKDTLKLEKDNTRIANKWTFKIDPKAKPKTIDVVDGDKVMPGIYDLDGDNLKICMREKGDERPTKFESDNTRVVVMVLKREPKEPKPALEPKKGDNNERQFSFEFRDAPWQKVVEWYAEISGLPYIAIDKPPAGTFNFSAPLVNGKPRTFNLTGITEALNSGLSGKGYKLVRRNASFSLVLLNGGDDLKDENKRLTEELRAALDRAKAAELEARAQRDLAEKARQIAEEQRRVADENRRNADTNRRVADEQRRKAEKSLEEVRKQLDAALKEIEKLKNDKK